ncbi:MAG: hypothetical protein ACUVS1_04430 [Actinomycetota bacterium]
MRKKVFPWLQTGTSLAVGFFALAFLLYILAFYGYLDPESKGGLFIFDILPVAAACFSIAAVVILLRNFGPGDPPRLIWRLILASLTLDLAAEFTWFAYEALAGVEVPYPSLADAFWLSAYLPFIAALVLVLRSHRRLGLPFRKGLSAATLVLLVAILVAVNLWLIAPVFIDVDATLADKVLGPAYVYLDFAVLALALLVAATYYGGTHGTQWSLISSAFLLFAAGDILFNYISWQGYYATGNQIDLLWLAGYLIMGVAALNQREILLREKKRFNV